MEELLKKLGVVGLNPGEVWFSLLWHFPNCVMQKLSILAQKIVLPPSLQEIGIGLVLEYWQVFCQYFVYIEQWFLKRTCLKEMDGLEDNCGGGDCHSDPPSPPSSQPNSISSQCVDTNTPSKILHTIAIPFME